MKVISKRIIWFLIPACLLLIGILSMIFRGFNLDIEFAGGTLLQIDLHQNLSDFSEIEAIAASVSGDSNPQVQAVSGAGGDTQVSIKTKELTSDQIKDLYLQVAKRYGLDQENELDLVSQSAISPIISSEMKRSAILSTLIAGVLMLIYITIRFRNLNFGFSAVIALLHDVLIVIALYTILQIPVNNSFIVALLTIVGYSINNTIVVFDRIRENRRYYKANQLEELCDESIRQTLGRSLATSITTISVVLLLYILGVQSLRFFALPLLVGMLAGTYSSLFIASPVWYILETKFGKK